MWYQKRVHSDAVCRTEDKRIDVHLQLPISAAFILKGRGALP